MTLVLEKVVQESENLYRIFFTPCIIEKQVMIWKNIKKLEVGGSYTAVLVISAKMVRVNNTFAFPSHDTDILLTLLVSTSNSFIGLFQKIPNVNFSVEIP